MRTWSRHSRRALPTQRSANAFAFGARIGVLTTSRPSVRKTSSEGSTELRVSVPKQDMFVVEAFGDRQVPSLLGDPHGIGAAGHAGDVDSSRGDLDEEQDVQRLQQHVKGSETIVPIPRRGALYHPAVLLAVCYFVL